LPAKIQELNAMGTALLPLVCAATLFAMDPAHQAGSYLCQPAYCIDDVFRAPLEAYIPQPGDIILCTDRKCFWQVTFNLACTGHPHHSSIVIQRPDGSLAVLEAGPHDRTHIEITDWYEHLSSYEIEGPVWVRRRRTPLTPEQSARLTEFAYRQQGKRFALVRLGAQLTPFRSRGPLRTYFMGGPHGPDRWSYFCSETVLEACVYAGLLDPKTTRPCATYPRDMFYDDSWNLFLKKHFSLAPGWYPPARWTSALK
jgi:hypothetical protein